MREASGGHPGRQRGVDLGRVAQGHKGEGGQEWAQGPGRKDLHCWKQICGQRPRGRGGREAGEVLKKQALLEKVGFIQLSCPMAQAPRQGR